MNAIPLFFPVVSTDESPIGGRNTLKKRRGDKKTIIAIVRMLLTATHAILKKAEPYDPSHHRAFDVTPVNRPITPAEAISLVHRLFRTKNHHDANSVIQDGDQRGVESLGALGIEKLSCGLYILGEMVYVPLSSITACCGKGYNVYDNYSLDAAVAVRKKNAGALQKGMGCFPLP
jgi:hypothetical protein